MVFWQWAQTVPLKGLVLTWFRLVGTLSDLPWWVVPGPTAWYLAVRRLSSEAHIAEVLQTVHPGLARSRGLAPYMPPQLGEMGLVPWGGIT